jgi:hypothetical protein
LPCPGSTGIISDRIGTIFYNTQKVWHLVYTRFADYNKKYWSKKFGEEILTNGRYNGKATQASALNLFVAPKRFIQISNVMQM